MNRDNVTDGWRSANWVGAIAALLLFALMVCLLMCGTGCASLGPTKEQTAASTEAYQSYVNQQLAAQMIRIYGSDTEPATLTMTGTEVIVSMPIPQRSVLNSDNTRGKLIEMLGSVGRMALGVWGATEMADSINAGSRSTTNNYGTAP